MEMAGNRLEIGSASPLEESDFLTESGHKLERKWRDRPTGYLASNAVSPGARFDRRGTGSKPVQRRRDPSHPPRHVIHERNRNHSRYGC